MLLSEKRRELMGRHGITEADLERKLRLLEQERELARDGKVTMAESLEMFSNSLFSNLLS